MIRVAIVGVGSCASALVQGVEYYSTPQSDGSCIVAGLTYDKIGGYQASDIQFVTAFDVDARKVGKSLRKAIYEKPNCNMRVVDSVDKCVANYAMVKMGPVLDGVAPHMSRYHDNVTFLVSDAAPLSKEDIVEDLQKNRVDVVLNYLPVGSEEASRFYVDCALEAGCHFVNCIPTFISSKEAIELEQQFIDRGLTIVGSDMRSGFGASRLSEVIQGSMLDAGLTVTQHIQTNMAAGSTQGEEHYVTGRTANTDFLNMAEKDRLESKHISKENVIRGQDKVRDVSLAGKTLFAGPSLTVTQIPGPDELIRSSDNKIANFDIIAYGFAGARYELTARLSVQDSPNSGAVVIDAVRFCKVASEMGIVGYLRGPSAWTQKTPPVQLRTADAKFECDALARRQLTDMTRPQLSENEPKASKLPHGFNDSDKD